MKAKLFFERPLILGEGPLWDYRLEQLYVIDIEQGLILTLGAQGDLLSEVSLPGRVGSISLTRTPGRLLAALEQGLVFVDPTSGEHEPFLPSLDSTPGTRLNDGKPGPDGALYVGSIDIECKNSLGSFYRVRSDRSADKLFGGTTVSNGLDWNPDGTIFYHADSRLPLVSEFSFHSGTLGVPRLACTTARHGEQIYPERVPDGLCVDSVGHLWVAIYGGGCVRCFDPGNGDLKHEVELPVPRVTSCTFGGPNLDTLFITTAREHMSEADLERWPLSGSVFTAKVGRPGKNAFIFAG